MCAETGTSRIVSAVIRRIKSPNCLLSQESSSIFKAGADHTLNPAFSPLKLPQLSQQMVQESTHPPPSNAHSQNTHTHTASLLVNIATHTHTPFSLICADSSEPGDRKGKQE